MSLYYIATFSHQHITKSPHQIKQLKQIISDYTNYPLNDPDIASDLFPIEVLNIPEAQQALAIPKPINLQKWISFAYRRKHHATQIYQAIQKAYPETCFVNLDLSEATDSIDIQEDDFTKQQKIDWLQDPTLRHTRCFLEYVN